MWVVPALLTRMSSAAERRQRLRHGRGEIGFLGDVAAHGDGVVADGARGRLRRIDIDVGERDARALARIGFGDAFADAGSGAGDQSGFAFQTHVQLPFGTTPYGFAQPSPSSVRVRGLYSQPIQPA